MEEVCVCGERSQIRLIFQKNLLTPEERASIERALNNDHQNEEETDQETLPIEDDTTDQDAPNETPINNTRTPAEDSDESNTSVEEQEEATEEETNLLTELKNEYERIRNREDKEQLPSLKSTNRLQLGKTVAEINKFISKVQTTNVTELNSLVYAGAFLAARKLNAKVNPRQNKRKRDPPWKHRIEKGIQILRKHLSWMTEWKREKLRDEIKKKELERKYKVTEVGLNQTIETVKQRLMANRAKITRFEQRVKGYHQNRLFRTNQRRLYKELKGETSGPEEPPNAEESKRFWSNIWSREVEHNQEAEWLRRIRQNRTERTVNFKISRDDLDRQLKKTPNWKAPGPDQVQGYWIKAFTSLHDRLVRILEQCLRSGTVPEWMTTGRTVLIQKDKTKGNEVSNYRPITCLPMMWKITTGIIYEKLYNHLDQSNVLPREQKGCRRDTRGTKDHLLIDKMIMKQAKSKRKDLSMAWIDYKKAFDMVPHSWLVECLSLYGAPLNVIRFLQNTMKNWKVILTSANKTLGEVSIKRGIFQGDSLSPLLFVISMIPMTAMLNDMRQGYRIDRSNTINHLLYMDDLKLFGKNEEEINALVQAVKTYSNDINMEFGIQKCGVLNITKGEVTASEGIEVADGQTIQDIETEGYKYLGVLEHNTVLHSSMKDKIKKEYMTRLRCILKSKLNAGNTIKAINTWAVPVVRYAAGIVNWTQQEKRQMDTKTRKLMTIYRALHPRSCVARLYIKRKEGGRGLLNIEDCIDAECRALGQYVKDHNDSWLQLVWTNKVLKGEETADQLKKRKDQERKTTWKELRMSGQYIRQVEDQQEEKASWNWLTRGEMKRETEGMLLAAQENAIRTRAVSHSIDHANVSPLCRLCGKKNETINHVISECPNLAQREYKRRHDKVAQAVHWTLSKKHQLPTSEFWYQHQPEAAAENDETKILWDMDIKTDRVISARRPDIILIDKVNNEAKLIDIAIPYDSRIKDKEREKIQKYQDLKIELTRIWKMKVEVVPIVVGALGAIPPGLSQNLDKIQCSVSPGLLQKSALLGTAHILRKAMGS